MIQVNVCVRSYQGIDSVLDCSAKPTWITVLEGDDVLGVEILTVAQHLVQSPVLEMLPSTCLGVNKVPMLCMMRVFGKFVLVCLRGLDQPCCRPTKYVIGLGDLGRVGAMPTPVFANGDTSVQTQ